MNAETLYIHKEETTFRKSDTGQASLPLFSPDSISFNPSASILSLFFACLSTATIYRLIALPKAQAQRILIDHLSPITPLPPMVRSIGQKLCSNGRCLTTSRRLYRSSESCRDVDAASQPVVTSTDVGVVSREKDGAREEMTHVLRPFGPELLEYHKKNLILYPRSHSKQFCNCTFVLAPSSSCSSPS
ncbi:hypothetical protein RJT34_00869 [Clitoria ternatea]|uniref:Uncharacterized protein n=1 Tax=Clitoria ternatea TaxID=43366 RepID=A0AAN9Q0W2_CLITE